MPFTGTVVIDGVEYADIAFVIHSMKSGLARWVTGHLWAEKEVLDALMAAKDVSLNGNTVRVVEVREEMAIFEPA